MRFLLPLFGLTLVLALACTGGTAEFMSQTLPPAPPVTSAVETWPYTSDHGQDFLQTGGLTVGDPIVLLGPPLAGTTNRQIVASGTVAESWPDLTRVAVDHRRSDLGTPELGRRAAPDDAPTIATLSVVPADGTVPTPVQAPTSPTARSTSPAAAVAAEPAVPTDLRTGSDDDRIAALEHYEQDGSMSSAIAWVMKNDPSDDVRFKAWRVVRARWNRGTGTTAASEAATDWAALSGPDRMRTEALALLGEKSSSLSVPTQALGARSDDVRKAAADALHDIGKRTGQRSEARKTLDDRADRETDDDVRDRERDLADDL